MDDSYRKVDELEEADEVDEAEVELMTEACKDWEDRQIFISASWGPLGLSAFSGHQWWLSQENLWDCIHDLGDDYP
jgi:hypothetical protein